VTLDCWGVRGGGGVCRRPPRPAAEKSRPGATDRRARPARHVDRLRVEAGLLDRDRVGVVGPDIPLAPHAAEAGQLVLEEVGPLLDRREVETQLAVLELVPTCP